MSKTLPEKLLHADDNNSQSLIKKVYSMCPGNWLALFFALIICLIIIIVIPIVYSIESTAGNTTTKNLSWDVTGKTIFNKTNLSSQNLSLGLMAGIAFDTESNLYVVDAGNNRVYQLDENYQLRAYIGQQNGSSGSDLNSLDSPYDIHVFSPTRIYIADTNNNRILCWNPSSDVSEVIANSTTTGLNHPKSVTMDDTSTMYIADYGGNRIVSINMNNGTSSSFLQFRNGLSGTRETYVESPISIKYHRQSSTIVIAQETGYNVIRWNRSSSYWTLIAGSASSQLNGTTRTLFNRLCYANIDQYEGTYVADCYNQRIQYYKGDLTKGKTIAGVILARGNNSYIFNQPTSVTLDNQNNVIVADSKNFRIQKFHAI